MWDVVDKSPEGRNLCFREHSDDEGSEAVSGILQISGDSHTPLWNNCCEINFIPFAKFVLRKNSVTLREKTR